MLGIDHFFIRILLLPVTHKSGIIESLNVFLARIRTVILFIVAISIALSYFNKALSNLSIYNKIKSKLLLAKDRFMQYVHRDIIYGFILLSTAGLQVNAIMYFIAKFITAKTCNISSDAASQLSNLGLSPLNLSKVQYDTRYFVLTHVGLMIMLWFLLGGFIRTIAWGNKRMHTLSFLSYVIGVVIAIVAACVQIIIGC